jgi:hypothetical protein
VDSERDDTTTSPNSFDSDGDEAEEEKDENNQVQALDHEQEEDNQMEEQEEEEEGEEEEPQLLPARTRYFVVQARHRHKYSFSINQIMFLSSVIQIVSCLFQSTISPSLFCTQILGAIWSKSPVFFSFRCDIEKYYYVRPPSHILPVVRCVSHYTKSDSDGGKVDIHISINPRLT